MYYFYCFLIWQHPRFDYDQIKNAMMVVMKPTTVGLVLYWGKDGY